MGLHKYRKDYKVQEYKFDSFNDFTESVESFEFRDLSEVAGDLIRKKLGINEDVIRIERKAAEDKRFEINPVVKELRGISDQEKKDYEKKVQFEIQNRLSAVKSTAEEEGFKKGFEAGHQQAYEEAREVFSQKINEFIFAIDEIKEQREELYRNEMTDAYKLIRSLAKWVCLKEIDEDNKYLKRLMEKLILELNQKKNLLIRVSAENFGQMEGVLEEVQEKVGTLTNVRIEIDHEMNGDKGIILESEKGIIDGSFKSQFETFDRVFDSVGINSNDSES